MLRLTAQNKVMGHVKDVTLLLLLIVLGACTLTGDIRPARACCRASSAGRVGAWGHSITLSARARMLSGILSPTALAILKLTRRTRPEQFDAAACTDCQSASLSVSPVRMRSA